MSEETQQASRRALMLAAASSVVAAATPVLAAPRQTALADLKKDADVACLYHCDFGEPQRFTQMLQNIANHYSAYDADPFALQLAIVAHGPGVKFFLENLDDTAWREETVIPKIFERVEDVAKNGLKVHLCEITFSRLKIDKSKARKAEFVGFVPSGVAAVAAMQAKGFAYLKVG
ncbi:DsrE family protein [Boseaceae bacterium BT-24-1]|nr:DsrE family protein [Boseaceae bacterium BT-24-1]